MKVFNVEFLSFVPGESFLKLLVDLFLMKSVVGLVMGIIGSVFAILASIIFGVMGILIYLGKGGLEDVGGSTKLMEFAGSLSIWLFVLFVWFLVLSIIGLVYSGKMNREGSVKKGGIGCLVIGILTINIFLVIGGVLGIMAAGNSAGNEVARNIEQVSNPVPVVSNNVLVNRGNV